MSTAVHILARTVTEGRGFAEVDLGLGPPAYRVYTDPCQLRGMHATTFVRHPDLGPASELVHVARHLGTVIDGETMTDHIHNPATAVPFAGGPLDGRTLQVHPTSDHMVAQVESPHELVFDPVFPTLYTYHRVKVVIGPFYHIVDVMKGSDATDARVAQIAREHYFAQTADAEIAKLQLTSPPIPDNPHNVFVGVDPAADDTWVPLGKVVGDAVFSAGVVGGDYQPNPYGQLADRLRDHIPGLDDDIIFDCPASECATAETKRRAPLWNLIQHLNDYHKWTRESIADWLDTLDVDLTIHDTPQSEPEPINYPDYEHLKSKTQTEALWEINAIDPVVQWVYDTTYHRTNLVYRKTGEVLAYITDQFMKMGIGPAIAIVQVTYEGHQIVKKRKGNHQP